MLNFYFETGIEEFFCTFMHTSKMNSGIFAKWPPFSAHNKSPVISLSYNLDNLTTHLKAFFPIKTIEGVFSQADENEVFEICSFR